MKNRLLKSKSGLVFLATDCDLDPDRPEILVLSREEGIIGGIKHAGMSNSSEQKGVEKQTDGFRIHLKDEVSEKTEQQFLKDLQHQKTIDFISEVHKANMQYKLNALRSFQSQESQKDDLER